MIKREDIQIRVGATGKSSKGSWAMGLLYIDARTAHEELDRIYGCPNWDFEWSEVQGHKFAIKGRLTIHIGEVTIIREDVGYPQSEKMKRDVDDTEVLKDAVSDALKRCAVQLGIGRILYQSPKLYSYNVKVNKQGRVIGFDEQGERELNKTVDDWYSKLEIKEDGSKK